MKSVINFRLKEETVGNNLRRCCKQDQKFNYTQVKNQIFKNKTTLK